jgi:hypothetical protein
VFLAELPHFIYYIVYFIRFFIDQRAFIIMYVWLQLIGINFVFVFLHPRLFHLVWIFTTFYPLSPQNFSCNIAEAQLVNSLKDPVTGESTPAANLFETVLCVVQMRARKLV